MYVCMYMCRKHSRFLGGIEERVHGILVHEDCQFRDFTEDPREANWLGSAIERVNGGRAVGMVSM